MSEQDWFPHPLGSSTHRRYRSAIPPRMSEVLAHGGWDQRPAEAPFTEGPVELRIIERLAESEEPLGIREVCEAIGIARSTAYRILDVLIAGGWVQASGSPRRFSATWRVTGLGLRMLAHQRPREVIISSLIELAKQTHQMGRLAFYQHAEIIITDSVDFAGDRSFVRSSFVHFPALLMAQGRAVLSHYSDDYVRKVASNPLPKITEFTDTDPETLFREVKRAGTDGYAMTVGQTVSGLVSVGAAILDASDLPVAGVSLDFVSAGPDFADRAAELGRTLKSWARRTSFELGFAPRGIMG